VATDVELGAVVVLGTVVGASVVAGTVDVASDVVDGEVDVAADESSSSPHAAKNNGEIAAINQIRRTISRTLSTGAR
jgi:hypothetical protein